MSLPAIARLTDPASVYLARLDVGSRPAQASALRTLAGLAAGRPVDPRDYPWHALRYEHTVGLRLALAERYPAAATANRHLSALRGVLKEAWRMGLIDDGSYAHAVDLAAVPGESEPSGRALSSVELDALFGQVAGDQSARGLRDLAMLALLYAAGLRRAELVRLDRVDCRQAPVLIVHGKRRKVREQPVAEWAARPLVRWIAATAKLVPDRGPVFVPVSRFGVLASDRLDSRAVAKIMGARCAAAGIRYATPHDLRRTYASVLLANGVDLSMVSTLMRHGDVRTTARYDRRDAAKMQDAADSIVPPVLRSA